MLKTLKKWMSRKILYIYKNNNKYIYIHTPIYVIYNYIYAYIYYIYIYIHMSACLYQIFDFLGSEYLLVLQLI